MLSGWFETRTMQMEYARLGIDTDPWEIPTWQGTSALSSLMLVALVGWAEARWPLRWGELRHHLFLPLLNFEWVAARIDRSLGPLSEGT